MWLALLVVVGVLPAMSIWLIREAVDLLVAASQNGFDAAALRPVLTVAAGIAGVQVGIEVLNVVLDWLGTAQAERVEDHVQERIHTQASRLDMAHFESPRFYDQLERVSGEAKSRPLALLTTVGTLIQQSVTLVAMAGLLIPYGVWLPAVLVASTLPVLWVLFRHNRRYHAWWERRSTERRWLKYLDLGLTNQSFAPEMRLFGLGDYFRDGYRRRRHTLRSERLDLAADQGRAKLGAALLTFAVSGAAMLWMLVRTVQGRHSLGDLTLFYQAFQRGQSVLTTLMRNLGQIYSHALFLRNLFEFLELEPRVVDPAEPEFFPEPIRTGISFSGVNFAYPGSRDTVLDDFDLHLPAGKTTAIVGANGAGKSTLIKLICRFYDPSAGAVTVDGVDLRQLSLNELRRRVSVHFQFPVPFFFSAGESIRLGDLNAPADSESIERAARQAGAHEVIRRLPDGYDSQLGKWFPDGSELSGGEWQRVALARSFFRQAEILILDEPTSFMDAWAEAEWLKRFRHLACNRTALVITHRFTTAMIADVIHVMERGEIVESGSHGELLAMDGRYAHSWKEQMSGWKPETDPLIATAL